MKLINGDKLERHLDYLIKRDNQFAKMCDGDDDYSRQRKYCFEVDALAYQLCKSVMDYYLVKDVQPVNQWISVKDRLPDKSCECLGIVDGEVTEVSYSPKCKELICVWSMCDADGCKPLSDDAVTHWMPLPEPPQD
jgi:hypothetical protein